MGTYMTCYAEKKVGDAWENLGAAFDWQSYGLFGFLADVRNDAAVPSLTPLFSHSQEDQFDDESFNFWWWLPLDELTLFDYSDTFENRCDGRGGTLPVGQGVETTFVEFLGEAYFDELTRLASLGAGRIVFSFD